jgi:peptidoglycan-N-acetylglucosamine deacetylase
MFRVALTLDAEHPDRPHRTGGTERVLDILAQRELRATFFIQGRWAEAFPVVARKISDAGHLVGNHSHYHARMPLLTDAGISADVLAAERAIRRTTGVDPRPWFRCPFGAGTDDPRVIGALTSAGYTEAGWEIDGNDWHRAATGPRLADAVLRATIEHGDGARVLLHPWTTATRTGLPLIIDGLRAAGATFIRLDSLP